MNEYERNSILCAKYQILKGYKLLKSTNAIINHVVILPTEQNTLFVYSGHIARIYPEWVATGFDNEMIYKNSGIYINYQGKVMPEELGIYALIKTTTNLVNYNYEAIVLIDLITSGEVDYSNNQDLYGSPV